MDNRIIAFRTDEVLSSADFDLLEQEYHVLVDVWGKEVPEKTLLKVAYDNERLYFLFRSEFDGTLPRKYYKKRGKVYRADCTEIFIDFQEKQTHYYELDVSPFNKTFTAYIENFDDENIKGKLVDKNILETYTKLHEHYYDTLYILPFKNFILDGMDKYSCKIRFNAYRVKVENGKRVSRVLKPTMSLSHHIKNSFIRLILE